MLKLVGTLSEDSSFKNLLPTTPVLCYHTGIQQVFSKDLGSQQGSNTVSPIQEVRIGARLCMLIENNAKKLFVLPVWVPT